MLSAPTIAALAAAGLDAGYVEDLAARTLTEDLGGGVDVTSVATIPADQKGTAAFVPRQAGVVAGIAVAMACLDTAASDALDYELVGQDGPATAGETVLRVHGLTRSLLTAERSALNLL
jgi:nicotinate-nucleotide pyrophosphorylase (carboxylating)